MTSKYDPLADHLRRQSGSPYTLSFDEIDQLLWEGVSASGRERGGLPLTARKKRQWWDNDYSPRSTHYQSKRGWLADWEVASVDWENQSVTYQKVPA